MVESREYPSQPDDDAQPGWRVPGTLSSSVMRTGCRTPTVKRVLTMVSHIDLDSTASHRHRQGMSVLMVRSRIRAEYADEVDAAIGRMFAAIREAAPEGIRYASAKLPDNLTYVALLSIDDGVDNPLPGLPEFREFQQNLRKWTDDSPSADPLTVVGSYRFF
jgi:hypothetical protein